MRRRARKFMLKDFKAVDVIALVVILGMFFLQYKGISTMIPQSVLLIVGYYFGKKSEILNGNDNSQHAQ